MKKRILFSMFTALLVLQGCSAAEKQGDNTEIQNAKVQNTETRVEIGREKNSISQTEIEKDLNSFQNLKAVKYAGDGKLVILADQMYLYDVNKTEVTAQAKCLKQYDYDFELYPIEDGYVTLTTDKDFHMICRFYDRSLKKTKQVRLYDDFGLKPFAERDVAVSADGKKLAVSVISSGLYLCDLEKGQKSQLFAWNDSDYEGRNGFAGMNQIGICSDTIVFISRSFDVPVKENSYSHVTHGVIQMDGSDFQVERGNEYGKLQQVSGGVLISEDIPDHVSGEVYLYRPEKGTVLSLKEKDESTNAYISDNGNYVMTSVRVENTGWRLRVYQDDGTMTNEYLYERKDTEGYREPYLYLLEECHLLVAYFRPYGDNGQYKIAVMPYQEKPE